MIKLLHVSTKTNEDFSLKVDLEDKTPGRAKYQQVKERKNSYEYATLAGWYRFSKTTGEVTLDTGAGPHKPINWTFEVEEG